MTKFSARTIAGPLGLSIAAIAACVVALVMYVPPVLAALFSHSAEELNAISQIDSMMTIHERETKTNESRFLGRSAFYIPPRPVVPEPAVAREAAPPPDPRIEPAPPTYGGGLAPVWSFGDKVVFKRGPQDVVVTVGQEIQGHRIVHLNAPYWVEVAWTREAEGHVSYEEGVYRLRFWKSAEEGMNAPLLASPPDPANRARALEASGALAAPAIASPSAGTPMRPGAAPASRDGPIRRDSRPVRDDDDDDDN